MALILMLAGFSLRGVDFTEAAQTATAGLITLIPEGLVLLMSVTLAVAAVRLARQNTLVQQMAATEALAAVDTICVDKTGTLTDGTLELIEVAVADPDGRGRPSGRSAASPPRPASATAPSRRSPRRFPAPAAEPVTAEVPFSSQLEVERPDDERRRTSRSYVIGAPDVLVGAGALTLPASLAGAGSSTTAGAAAA